MSNEFAGQTAIVTGAARGIGRAVALTLAGGGARVVVADRDLAAAQATAASLPDGRGTAVETDIASEASILRLYDVVARSFGRLDILVNNAGIYKLTPFADISAGEWDQIMTVNLRGTFLMCREAFKVMRGQKSGKIVTIASVAGKTGGVNAGAHYAASKAAVICLTKSLAGQAAPYRINVNAVSPGPTQTDLTAAWGEATNAALAANIPWKEYAAPQDVADAVAFLASARARYITGEVLDVNGGMLMD
jgi:3-oxoacyl-[acyl-carrier protein] reductase